MPLHKKAVVKVKGTPIEIDGEMYVLPPLSLLHLEAFQEKLKTFTADANNPDQVSFFVDALTSAMQRNYPEVTRDELAAKIGLESMQELTVALVSVSGLTHRAGEVPKPTAEPEEMKS